MRFRDLLGGGRPGGDAPSPQPAGGGELTRFREDAHALLSAGDDAIARALSRDSKAFLEANRQQGGQ